MYKEHLEGNTACLVFLFFTLNVNLEFSRDKKLLNELPRLFSAICKTTADL